jgi:Rod binding domain-containing protein
MSSLALTAAPPASLSAGPAAAGARDPGKVHDAAQQFEALLMGQILRSARQGGTGWLSTGEDSSSESATDYAEQQFAAVLSQHGGLGLATLISKGLSAADSTNDTK